MELVVLIAFFAFFYIIDVLQKRKIRKEIEDDIAKKRKISSKNKKSSAQLDELFKLRTKSFSKNNQVFLKV
jgi:response regulator of citrate/malate metabolism